MSGKTKSLARAIGIANIILGLRVLLNNYRWITGGEIWTWMFHLERRNNGFSAYERIFLSILFFIFIPVLPAAKIITGSGLFFLARWARRTTIMVVLIDFLIKLYAVINYSVNYWLMVHFKPEWALQGADTIRVRINMWPTYIIALFDLLVIAILTRKATRSYFEHRSV